MIVGYIFFLKEVEQADQASGGFGGFGKDESIGDITTQDKVKEDERFS